MCIAILAVQEKNFEILPPSASNLIVLTIVPSPSACAPLYASDSPFFVIFKRLHPHRRFKSPSTGAFLVTSD